MLITDVFALKGPEFFTALSTLIITQTDGRTGYSNTPGQLKNIQTQGVYFEVKFDLSFSDRPNNLAPSFPPPNQSPGIPYQLPQGFSNRDTDSTIFIIRNSTVTGAGTGFTAEYNSLRWVNQFKLQFTLVSQTGIYQAFGATIAKAPGQALYSLAFRS
ncbi:MAG: hypothetical protein ABIQ88_20970 [Chitinophagaceae bacterium]